MKKRRQPSNQKADSSKPPTGKPVAAQGKMALGVDQPKKARPDSRNDKSSPPLPVDEAPVTNLRKRTWIQVLAIVCVIVVGLWVRLEDLVPWHKEPARAFYGSEPLLTALDGLFYLTLARDLVEGTYQPIDEKRAVPDSPPRPFPPPLISFLTATVARIVPISLNWIAVLLPAVLGVLLFFPVYALGRSFGGPLAGIIAGLMVLLSPYYVYRSGLGWLDTDSLNVTFTTAAAYFFLKFGLTPGNRRYLFLLAGLINYGLCLWWWDQTPDVVTVICLAPLGVAVLFFYRPQGRERLVFWGSVILGVLALLLWKGIAPVSHLVTLLWSKLAYISKETAGTFPNIGVSISEQVKPSFETMATISSGNLLAFFVALLGLGWLIRHRWKESLFLGILFALSVLAFVYARRFAIFCAPLTALGVGFLIDELWKLRTRFKPLTYATPLFLAILIWPMVAANHAQTYWPKEQPNLVAGLAEAQKLTPPDAVIWAWWDHGYTIPYWARRASVNDGELHYGDRTVFNGLPLATDSERLSANLIHFWVARGVKGLNKVREAMGGDEAKGFLFIKKILSAGPEQARAILTETPLQPVPTMETTEDWLEFFFPSNPRPVYLFLDELLTRTSYWWFWFGSYDVLKRDGTHVDYRVAISMYDDNGVLKSKAGGIEVDTRTGNAKMGAQTLALQEIAIWDGKDSQIKRFNHQSGVVFEVAAPIRIGVLMHKDIASSVFNKLYLRQFYSKEYFSPVLLNTPWYQLWEVRGESWKK
jgi:dolichyl-diphosphooligosaccharide--protein glycosyltransferase